MKRISKKRKEILAKYDFTKSYTLPEACDLVKGISTTKFDASVDISVRLGVDPRKANQMVRGTVALPHGTGKDVKVLVLCTPDKENEAKESGADAPMSYEMYQLVKMDEFGQIFIKNHSQTSEENTVIEKSKFASRYKINSFGFEWQK